MSRREDALGGASFEYLGRNMVFKIMEFGKLPSTSRIRRQLDFIEHLGFKTYKRTDHDEEGNPYPLLYMKLM